MKNWAQGGIPPRTALVEDYAALYNLGVCTRVFTAGFVRLCRTPHYGKLHRARRGKFFFRAITFVSPHHDSVTFRSSGGLEAPMS